MIAGLLRVVPVWAWALAALLAWGGWQRHQAKTQTAARAVAEQQAAVAKATAAAQADARERERLINTNAKRATDAADQKRQAAQAAAAGARAELDRLRNALAAAPTGGASAPAGAASGPDGSASFRAVVAECAGRLVEVAADSDACGAQLSGLQGWVRAVIDPGREP